MKGAEIRGLGFQTSGWDFWDVTNLPHLKESRPRALLLRCGFF
jgi:hypothetical protein